MLCEKVFRVALADGCGEAVLGEGDRLQGDCVAVAVDRHLVFQTIWGRQ